MTARRSSTGATDDGNILSRPVHLYAAGRWRAVSLSPERLPPAPAGATWQHEGSFALGVQHVELPGTEPEPVITGLAANGFYVWQISPDEVAKL